MKKLLFPLTLAVISIASCHKPTDNPVIPEPEPEVKNNYLYVNAFAYSTMKTYYLWEAEIAQAFASWNDDDEPKSKVKEARYKDSEGKDIDKWTTLTDDYSSFVASVSGMTTTYGLDYTLYYTDQTYKTVCMVVTYTSDGSPARKAGLKRGDVIMKIGGNELGIDNYSRILTDGFIKAANCVLTLMDGRTVAMTAAEMYEDPVLLYKTFSFNDKKVGYLVYNSFTLASWERLIEACKYFKQECITELILDLRYNSGGYVISEYALASMLAPKSVVENNEVYEKAVYNAALQEALGDTDIRFEDSFRFTQNEKSCSFSTADANIGLSKIYVLYTSSSASASESLVVGLRSYMDIEIIGSQSSGKYCSGIIYPASSWVKDYDNYITSSGLSTKEAGKQTSNWGIYVMISRYADVNGETPCMPHGFVPDIEAKDYPLEGLELGDENETMLKTALKRAGKTEFAEMVTRAQRSAKPTPCKPLGGTAANAYRIILPESLPILPSRVEK